MKTSLQKIVLVSAFLLMATNLSFAQKKIGNETPEQKLKRMEWWTDARFGMFIHWGLYAMPARHEWIKRREKMTNEQYQKYFDEFNPDQFNPKLWAKEAKALAVIPNSGMAVTMDIGTENFIHPWDKETVGKRLSYMALAQTYGLKGFPYASPMYESVSFAGNVATVQFSNTANGLTSYGKPLSYFEIAGADKVFYPAKAVITKGIVTVSSEEVPNPVAVRYAFKDFVVGDLFNTEGFPASSFRTDDW